MAMTVNHNLFAQNVAGLFNRTAKAFNKSLQKLSSGSRVSVTDFHNVSEMEVAQQITSKLNGYTRAIAGGQDGISLIQTAEGALTEVDSMLQRMRELAVQASNDTLTGQDRSYIQAEIDQLRSEIDRIGNTTHFNNRTLLNGSAAALWSTIPKETQAIIKGALRTAEGGVSEGNFNISLLAAPPGEAEVQKSEIFLNTNTGKPAGGDTELSDVGQFTNKEGKFLLEDPQTFTITQGDGRTAQVTLYANDTLDSMAKKLNDAIANDLGQGQYVDDADNFATFVGTATENTSESVQGTLLIRSAVSGSKGTLCFSGSEELINAFGLNTIQEATESVYVADVKDAHTGEAVASVKVTGNKLIGVVNQNVDVEFDAMAGVTRTWNAASNSYDYNAAEYGTTVHIAENTLTFQMGIGSGENMSLSIGDMRSKALGLDGVLVTDHASAARSVTVIDNAIDTVATQRAKLGASQNRIEANLSNMRVAEEKMTAAESNIKDTDVAKELMNFTKLQIMMQAGTSMMAQANQTQESVLSLIR